MTPETFFAIWSAALGGILGSFANVCIHRLPRGESVVTPRSRCPRCGRPIAFYDNVPVLSWLLLRGRCRACAEPISPRYPLVEALTAALFFAAALAWGPSFRTAVAFVLAAASVILVATDLVHRILPDEVTVGGAALVGAFAAVRDAWRLAEGLPLRPGTSALIGAAAGAAIGSGLLLLVRQVYFLLRGVEGMGLGDVKMMLLVGAATGWRGVLPALFLAALSGALLGIGVAAARAVRFRALARRARRGDAEGAARGGFLLGADGALCAAGPAFLALPGVPGEGKPLAGAGAARPLAAFVRCARRRARRELPSATDRLFVEEGEFFRVLAVRAEPLPDGRLLVLLGRADVPFGVFLALGGCAAYAVGPSLLALPGSVWGPR